MKLAIVGSRGIRIENLEEFIPEGIDEIVSGGAKGIDECAAEYAREKGIKLTEFLPEYERFGRAAPLKRNGRIAEYADEAIAFWDGRSRGTKFTIDAFERLGKRVSVVMVRCGAHKASLV